MKNVFGIHPTAVIGDNVRLGDGVTVGAHTIVYDNVVIGAGTVIGAHCILGEPNVAIYSDVESYRNPVLTIGEGSLIRSGTILYAGSELGAGFECGHRVTIREGASIGHHVRIGTLSDIQGHCEIGNYVRFHSNVHVGHKSTVKDYVWIFPYVVLTNDPHPPSETLLGVTVEEFAVIATMSVILPGVTVGRNSLVGASSMVRKDVEPETVVAGNPAKTVASIHDIKSRADGTAVYPWPESFDRGMPWQGIGFKKWRDSAESQ
ncbi:N-acetyltransferase [Dyella sp. 333MFSha]|uniref:N-acetyltransferase n=1 Tax=Dyella sp. 333MFSha TaxID=1798240 RepID=UPI0008866EB8|nr:N-acetyltransferase [Dyella sp. 333MFSha]SDG47194.1 Acyl-[acyl carrier protein]--UDP-N-acetylglucosamine O-acyltransferase [Dyella sp. 333MFSha]